MLIPWFQLQRFRFNHLEVEPGHKHFFILFFFFFAFRSFELSKRSEPHTLGTEVLALTFLHGMTLGQILELWHSVSPL